MSRQTFQSIEPKRPPATLRLAAWAWIGGGTLLILTPLAAAALLGLQYRSLRRNAYRLTDLTDWLDRDDALDLAPYIAEFERIETWLMQASAWVLPLLMLCYLLSAIACITIYLLVGRYTRIGSNGARITGTVLAALSAPLILLVWQFFVGFSWLPLDALWANHLGLAAVALHAIGVVLAWLPPSNAFVRDRSPSRFAGRSPVAQ